MCLLFEASSATTAGGRSARAGQVAAPVAHRRTSLNTGLFAVPDGALLAAQAYFLPIEPAAQINSCITSLQ
jgi:hypothetical protein